MNTGELRERDEDCARRWGGVRVRARGRGCRVRTRRALAAALALTGAALVVAVAAAPASAAIVVGEPHLTLKSTYEGTLVATLLANPGPEEENLKVEENFTVVAEQQVDNQGHTIVLREVKVTGSETGTVGNGKGGTKEVGCTLKAGEGHRPTDFTPEGVAPVSPTELEEGKEGEHEREAFIGNPALDYKEFRARTFLPTKLALVSPMANELVLEKVTGKSASSCAFAASAGSSTATSTNACTGGGEGGESFTPYAPEETKVPFEGPPHVFAPIAMGKCEKTPSGAKETLDITGKVTIEAQGAEAVRKAKQEEEEKAVKEQEAKEKETKEKEAEALKKKEAEERRKKEEEEAAKKVEVPKPPAPPPPPPPPPPEPPEALLAREGRAPKRLKPAQVRRGRKSPSTSARNRALVASLTGALRVKAANCTVTLAVDGAIDAVSFVAPIPGETTTGGAVTDPRTRNCLHLLAQLRTALATARHDPPSARYASLLLPARTAATSPPCLPTALTAAQYSACSGLVTAERESDRQLERAALVAAAVAGTVDRHSSAVRAGRQGDAEIQDVAYTALIAELAQSLERGNAANLTLAHTLQAAGTDVAFGPALAAHTARHLEGLVRRAHGARRSTLRTLLGAAQLGVPSLPGRYSAALAAPVAIGALQAGGSLTPRQLSLLVAQLTKQGQIPAAAGAAMLAQLKELRTATAAAATALRRKLGAEFREVTSEAGPLLEGATRVKSPRL